MTYILIWMACGLAVHLWFKYTPFIFGVEDQVPQMKLPWWTLAVDMLLGPIGIILAIKMWHDESKRQNNE